MATTAAAEPPPQAPADELLDLMSYQADVALKFDDGTELPGNTTVLGLWLHVLRGAVEALDSSPAPAGGGLRALPLPGTTPEEWRMLCAYLYPLSQAPDLALTNESVVALITLAAKYDTPAVLGRAEAFINARVSTFDGATGWRWLVACDAAGMDRVCKALAPRIISLRSQSGFGGTDYQQRADALAQLSARTLRLFAGHYLLGRIE